MYIIYKYKTAFLKYLYIHSFMKDKLRTKVHTGTLNFDVLTTLTDKGRFRPRGRRIQSEGKEERRKR